MPPMFHACQIPAAGVKDIKPLRVDEPCRSSTSYELINRQIVTKAVSSSIKERLNELMIDTEEHFREKNCKRLTYINAEYMMGRQMKNLLINTNLDNLYE